VKSAPALWFLRSQTAKPDALEADEPQRVAEATRRMGCATSFITAVAATISAMAARSISNKPSKPSARANPGIIIEVLVPDFNDRDWALQMVMDAARTSSITTSRTVERLTPLVRSRANTSAASPS